MKTSKRAALKKAARQTPSEELKHFFHNSGYRTVFTWLDKRSFGLNEYPEFPQEISINIYLLVVYVFVHEYMHYKYPDFPLVNDDLEEDLAKQIWRFIRRMTRAEIIETAEFLLQNAYWEDTAHWKRKIKKIKKQNKP